MRLCGGLVAYAVAWDLGVTVFSDFAWTDAIARQYIEECIAVTARESVLGGRGGLTYLAGAGPGTSQRKIIVDALQRRGVSLASQRSVIVTDSALVRGAATALSWLTRGDTHTFPTAELKRAAATAAFDDPVLTSQVEAYLSRGMVLVGLPVPR